MSNNERFVIRSGDKARLNIVAANLENIGKELKEGNLTVKTAKEALEVQASIIKDITKKAERL